MSFCGWFIKGLYLVYTDSPTKNILISQCLRREKRNIYIYYIQKTLQSSSSLLNINTMASTYSNNNDADIDWDKLPQIENVKESIIQTQNTLCLVKAHIPIRTK